MAAKRSFVSLSGVIYRLLFDVISIIQVSRPSGGFSFEGRMAIVPRPALESVCPGALQRHTRILISLGCARREQIWVMDRLKQNPRIPDGLSDGEGYRDRLYVLALNILLIASRATLRRATFFLRTELCPSARFAPDIRGRRK